MINLNCLEREAELELIAAEVFKTEKLKGEAVVELDFISSEDIKELNKRERGNDSVTDVLSFPAIDGLNVLKKTFNKKNYPFEFIEEDNAVLIGNIVICKKRAIEQAEEYGHSVKREISYLFLHGLLHLLGYDHIEEKDKILMRSREENVLNSLRIVRENN